MWSTAAYFFIFRFEILNVGTISTHAQYFKSNGKSSTQYDTQKYAYMRDREKSIETEWTKERESCTYEEMLLCMVIKLNFTIVAKEKATRGPNERPDMSMCVINTFYSMGAHASLTLWKCIQCFGFSLILPCLMSSLLLFDFYFYYSSRFLSHSHTYLVACISLETKSVPIVGVAVNVECVCTSKM